MSRKRASLPSASEASPPRKKAKRDCHFQDSWTELFPGIKKSSKGDLYARCTYCSSDFLVSQVGKVMSVPMLLEQSTKRRSVAPPPVGVSCPCLMLVIRTNRLRLRSGGQCSLLNITWLS